MTHLTRNPLLFLLFNLVFNSIADPGSFAETLSGRVVVDSDQDGRSDPGEPGLPGVAVTDGSGFSITDSDGFYRLSRNRDPLLPFRSRARQPCHLP